MYFSPVGNLYTTGKGIISEWCNQRVLSCDGADTPGVVELRLVYSEESNAGVAVFDI